jgi:hypothetical protein
LRHDHVGDQHVNRSRIVLRDLKRLVAEENAELRFPPRLQQPAAGLPAAS